MASLSVDPSAAVIDSEKPFEFELFVTPHSARVQTEKVDVLVKKSWGNQLSKSVDVEFATEVSTLLHFTEVVVDTRSVDESLALSSRDGTATMSGSSR